MYAHQTSPSDALAERVVDYIASSAIPAAKPEKMANDTATVWFDENNEMGYDGVGEGEAIAWVQDTHLIDELESAGKKVGYKGQLVKSLISMGALYGRSIRKQLGGDRRTKFYPFNPDAIGIDESDIRDVEPGENNDQVEV